MISKEKLIEDILQHENVLSDANYNYRSGYVARQNEIIDIINRRPAISAEDIDAAYLQLVKENTELRKRLSAEEVIHNGIGRNKEIP